MLANVITRARDGFRLGVAALQRELIGAQRQVLREDGQQLDERFVLLPGKDTSVEVSFLDFFQINVRAPFDERFGNRIEPAFLRMVQQNVAGTEKCYQI